MIDGISSIDNQAVLQELNQRTGGEEDDHGRSDFLKLLVAQLSNQDPLSPQDSGEFLSQLAQFSTVEGIEKLNLTMESFSSGMLSGQALQATALVGRSVQVPANIGRLNSGSALTGAVDLPQSSSNLTLGIYDQAGTLVRHLEMGAHGTGPVNFAWDGISDQGMAMPSGLYRVRAEVNYGGEPEEVPAFINANVDSVTTAAGGSVVLNLEAGLGSVSLNDVLQIN